MDSRIEILSGSLDSAPSSGRFIFSVGLYPHDSKPSTSGLTPEGFPWEDELLHLDSIQNVVGGALGTPCSLEDRAL